MTDKLTLERLKDVLSYDPETGLFYWRYGRPKVKAGAVAGGKMLNGYIAIRIDLVLYRAHRLAWLYVHEKWPAEHIDHINRDVGDNRISNLREATRSQNMANAKRKTNSRSGFKGVIAEGSKWRAYLGGYRTKYLGLFDTPEEAHAVYLAAATARHGEFARGE
jgi:hypothetical protein